VILKTKYRTSILNQSSGVPKVEHPTPSWETIAAQRRKRCWYISNHNPKLISNDISKISILLSYLA